jgi:hypothetical protein
VFTVSLLYVVGLTTAVAFSGYSRASDVGRVGLEPTTNGFASGHFRLMLVVSRIIL